jgi:hypothetical protein
VARFTPRRFTPRGNSSRHSLDRSLSGSQSQSGSYGEKNLLPLPRFETPTVQPVAISTEPFMNKVIETSRKNQRREKTDASVYVGVQVLMVVSVQIVAFWFVMSCDVVININVSKASSVSIFRMDVNAV